MKLMIKMKQIFTLTAKFDTVKYELFNFVAENCIKDHNKVNGLPNIE